MFAIFSQETALPPLGLLSFHRDSSLSDLNTAEGLEKAYSAKLDTKASGELQRQCSNTLDGVGRRSKGSQKIDLGNGNGLNFTKSPSCHHAVANKVSCIFSGDVKQWPELDSVHQNAAVHEGEDEKPEGTSAEWLLAFYTQFKEHKDYDFTSSASTEGALHNLANVDGSFAFVVYDRANRRVLAGRDRNGSQDLYWGSTNDGRLMFSTEVGDLKECNPTATAFPAGSLFVSENQAKAMQPGINGWMIDNHIIPGQLMSFVAKRSRPPKAPASASPAPVYRSIRAVPRVNSQGCLCGAVYRVASDNALNDWGTTC